METITNHRQEDEAEADAVLTAFVQAGAGARLDEWAARHPAQARDLARLAASRWVGDAAVSAAAPAAETRIRQIGLAALRACRPEPAAAAGAPLTSLLAAAKAAGTTADALSAALDLPVALFWKLHRRLIAPDSVPRSLVDALADAVSRTADDVAAYLRQPPQLAAGASYRADDAPAVGAQEPFAEALAADPDATDVHRARWLASEPPGGQ